jgi:hypothetical protein
MLVLKFETEIPLAEPNEEFGFITRLTITIRQFDSARPGPVGTARVAMIHCGDALNKGVSIHDVLDGDDEGLGVLDGILFEDGSLKEDYENGVGSDVLYVESLELRPEWRGRNIEEALTRRVFDTWGQGCAIGVVPVATSGDAPRWELMGFALVGGPDENARYAVMDLSLKHPRVVESEEGRHIFRVVPDDLE